MATAWGSAEDYEYLMGRWSLLLAPSFLRWARLPAGAEVLDVGCGTGPLSETLIAHGSTKVVGVDPSPTFIAYAAARLAKVGEAAKFEVGDAMKLQFPDGSFDASVAALVLNFVPDAPVAVTEMRRVVRRDGVVVACVWDYAKGMQMLRYFWDAAVELDSTAGPLDEGIRFPICKPDRLEALFQSVGLAEVETAHIDLPMKFRDFHDYWCPFLGGHGPSGGYTVKLSEGKRAQLRERIRAKLGMQLDGTIVLLSRAWAVRGVRT